MSESTAFAVTIDSPDGPFTIIADASQHVLASGWTDDAETLRLRIAPELRPERLDASDPSAAEGPVSAVRAFYDGRPEALRDVDVAASGTPWRGSVWDALRNIPAGTTLSYAQLADAAGNPAAVRAAASACASNPAGLFVPCHRVVRGDGSLGGFAWGLGVKESLLNREAA